MPRLIFKGIIYMQEFNELKHWLTSNMHIPQAKSYRYIKNNNSNRFEKILTNSQMRGNKSIKTYCPK